MVSQLLTQQPRGHMVALSDIRLLSCCCCARATNFRPIQLDEKYATQQPVSGSTADALWLHDGHGGGWQIQNDASLFALLRAPSEPFYDPLLLGYLCYRTICEQKNAIVFCSSKAQCVQQAKRVAHVLTRLLDDRQLHPSFVPNRSPDVLARRHQLLSQLQTVSLALDPMLQLTVTAGVAFHHAGLTFPERDLIESAYRSGTVSILCATTTLACGVNLGAARVLFTSLKTGRERMDAATYRQCAGRAGRKGKDASGESIILAADDFYPGRRINWKQHEQVCQRIIQQPMPPLNSCLDLPAESICRPVGSSTAAAAASSGPIYPYLSRLLLDAICSGLARTPAEVDFLCSHTLLHQQKSPAHLQEIIRRSITWLAAEEFISPERDRSAESVQPMAHLAPAELPIRYRATSLGFATTVSTLSPVDALVIHEHLSRARERLLLEGGLHILFLITPIHVSFEMDCTRYSNVSARAHRQPSCSWARSGLLSGADRFSLSVLSSCWPI